MSMKSSPTARRFRGIAIAIGLLLIAGVATIVGVIW